MTSTDFFKWFLSMLHEATTWQSFSPIKPRVLSGAIIPHPTIPTVIRSEGGGRPSRPSALAGIKVGTANAALAAPDTARKRRRLICPPFIEDLVMREYCAGTARRTR